MGGGWGWLWGWEEGGGGWGAKGGLKHLFEPVFLIRFYGTPNGSGRYSLAHYCTLRGQDQRLKCAIISIFYGAVLYLLNFWKIQHTWENIARLGKYV